MLAVAELDLASLPRGSHVCCLYASDAERAAALQRYVQGGYDHAERVHYFADVEEADAALPLVFQLGIAAAPRADALRADPAVRVYCPDGAFQVERMLDRLRTTYEEAVRDGFSGARVCGEMTWARRGLPGSERLVEYESRINTVVTHTPCTAVCQYDVTRFDGETLFGILSVHPLLLIRNRLVHNPHYVTPERWASGAGVA